MLQKALKNLEKEFDRLADLSTTLILGEEHFNKAADTWHLKYINLKFYFWIFLYTLVDIQNGKNTSSDEELGKPRSRYQGRLNNKVIKPNKSNYCQLFNQKSL